VSSPSVRPAPIVPIAAALIVGAATGGARPAPGAAAIAACAALALAMGTRRRPALAVACLAVAAAALGSAAQGAAWQSAGSRLEAAFGASEVRELDLVARVVSAPERDREGGRALAVETVATGRDPTLRLRLEIVDVPSDDLARIDDVRRGDTIRAWCRLRAPVAGPGRSEAEARRRLAAQRLDATGRVKSSRLVKVVSTGRWSPGRALDTARVRARNALDRAVGPAGATRAVLGAMLLGDRLLLDDETNALLRDAGLIHILSISGLHTALTVLLVLALLRRAGLGPRSLLFVGGAGLLAFAAFVGHGASVWRACASLAVGLIARLLARDVEPLAALALAAAMLVVAVPPLAFNAGFLLSVLATAGLLAVRPGTSAGGRRPSALARSMAASSGAYLATAPLLASLFGRLAPAALVANLAAAPLCAACLATGAAAIVSAGVPVVGGVAAGTAKIAVRALLATSGAACALPGGHLRVAPPAPALAAGYVALLLASWLFSARWSRGGARAVRLLFALFAIALHLGPPPPGTGPARAEVIDVGQGLAVMLRGTDGRSVLVDTGPSGNGRFDAGDRIVVPALAAGGCRRLEVLALSHDHDDHAGGARAVLRDLEVGELWVPVGSERDPLTRVVSAAAVARGVAVRALRRGEILHRAGFEIAVLHPGVEDRVRSLNDRCLVLRARTAGGASILLPGDLEAVGEHALLAAGADPRSGVLVAPHHGANGSSTAAFLSRVAPRVVVISSGAGNRFGHPGSSALARFGDAEARVLRTDRDGTVTLDERGASWRVSVEKEGRGDERQDEDQPERDRERDAAGPEPHRFVEEPRMAIPQHEQNDEPEGVCGGAPQDDALDGDENGERADGQPGDDAVRPREDREQRMTAVQLSHGEQVHRRDEHPDPGRTVNGPEMKGGDPVEQPLEEQRAQGVAEHQAVRSPRHGEHGGVGDTRDQERQGDQKARDRSGSGDVEQRLPRGDRPADPDDGSERADQHRRPGDEKRKRRRDAVVPAGEVVPHFVRAENQKEQRGVRHPVGKAGKRDEGAPRGVKIEQTLPRPAPGHRRGQKRGDQQAQMEPEACRKRRWGGRGFGHDAPRWEKAGRRPSISTALDRLASAGADTRCTPQRTSGVERAWHPQENAV
jgi:competence protein ComEC